jgi:hypothetical protein
MARFYSVPRASTGVHIVDFGLQLTNSRRTSFGESIEE